MKLTGDPEEECFAGNAGSQGVIDRPPRVVPQVEGCRDVGI